MKKYILDCSSVKSDGDFWDSYCDVVQPEGEGYFGRNLDAFWDAVSAGGPGWPGECQIHLVNVDAFARRNSRLYNGLKRIASDLDTGSSVKLIFPDTL
jgi:ribonuclease inhibitor